MTAETERLDWCACERSCHFVTTAEDGERYHPYGHALAGEPFFELEVPGLTGQRFCAACTALCWPQARILGVLG